VIINETDVNSTPGFKFQFSVSIFAFRMLLFIKNLSKIEVFGSIFLLIMTDNILKGIFAFWDAE